MFLPLAFAHSCTEKATDRSRSASSIMTRRNAIHHCTIVPRQHICAMRVPVLSGNLGRVTLGILSSILGFNVRCGVRRYKRFTRAVEPCFHGRRKIVLVGSGSRGYLPHAWIELWTILRSVLCRNSVLSRDANHTISGLHCTQLGHSSSFRWSREHFPFCA